MVLDRFLEVLDHVLAKCLGTCRREVNVGRALDLFQLWFTESIQIIAHDLLFFHDLGCDRILFLRIAYHASLAAGWYGGRVTPDKRGTRFL